ncbi:hypothetical protein OG21DRAFT_1511358 [Imleria badia]|nr:hypothetical protein OG21DRAFT_1511358 [Imleria badia]
MTVPVAGDSSDDELDWKEVHVQEHLHQLDTPLDSTDISDTGCDGNTKDDET